jgi:23S rRNA (uracil1939-C5)-methyltransferase
LRAAGRTRVRDTAAELFGVEPPIDPGVSWHRQASSFFQGNRFLTGSLVRRVLALSRGDRCVDLYAGVGLFAVALAALGKKVLAVEGEASSAHDLLENAKPWRERLRVIHDAVETAVTEVPAPSPDLVIVDPPRTGLSPAALRNIARWSSPRLVYVSCDPPTLARDAAQLRTHGFELESLDGFDLFPNTPHVEAIASFVYGRSA